MPAYAQTRRHTRTAFSPWTDSSLNVQLSIFVSLAAGFLITHPAFVIKPPLPQSSRHTILSNFCWGQTGSTTVATENSACTAVRGAALTTTRERERAELKKKKTHKKESRWPKCGDPPFLSQPPDASASPNAPCRVILTSSYHNYIFGALLTASLIYDISRYLFTHGGGAACISVSLEPEMNQSPGRKDELSPGQPRSERLKKGPEVFELVKFWNNSVSFFKRWKKMY